jgi:hypothetical protein
MPGSNPFQPSHNLLVKIAEIGDIKRRSLSLLKQPRYRAFSSSLNLYVQSKEVRGYRRYQAGSTHTAFLDFYVTSAGDVDVKKYVPGDWEANVDSTLALCRLFENAARVPKDWPQDKARAYGMRQQPDPNAIERVLRAQAFHWSELAALDEPHRDATGGPVDVFLDTLKSEWPIEYLECMWQPRNRPYQGERENACQSAWWGGYMEASQWISREDLTQYIIGMGNKLADTNRTKERSFKSQGLAMSSALAAVARLGVTTFILDMPQAPSSNDVAGFRNSLVDNPNLEIPDHNPVQDKCLSPVDHIARKSHPHRETFNSDLDLELQTYRIYCSHCRQALAIEFYQPDRDKSLLDFVARVSIDSEMRWTSFAFLTHRLKEHLAV